MEIASLVIQAIIAVFLIWYASETYKLRKEATYQRQIAIQPLIDFIYEPEDNPSYFIVENVGAGVALNLHIYLWISKSSQMLGLPEDDRPSIIKQNQRTKFGPLNVIDTLAIKKMHPKLSKLLDIMCRQPGLGAMVAIYEDAAGTTYYSQQNGRDSTNPLNFGKL